MKKWRIVVPSSFLVLVLAACGGSSAESPLSVQPPLAATEEPAPSPADDAGPPAAPDSFDTQTSDAGEVVIDVTPRTLGEDAWDFEVNLNTHSVSIDSDLTTVSALRCDRGQEYAPVAWEGSGPGGHHRSGVLRFAALDHSVSFVEVVIRNVANVPERTFRWDVSSSLASSRDSFVTQTPEQAPETVDGPAQVVLSAEEFRFGDVVMGNGVVARTIFIVNSGSGTLYIEGVVPT